MKRLLRLAVMVIACAVPALAPTTASASAQLGSHRVHGVSTWGIVSCDERPGALFGIIVPTVFGNVCYGRISFYFPGGCVSVPQPWMSRCIGAFFDCPGNLNFTVDEFFIDLAACSRTNRYRV